MSQYYTLKHLNELQSECSSKKEECEALLEAISDMFDSGMTCQEIEETIELSKFNLQNRNDN